jgi:hypothetical protein
MTNRSSNECETVTDALERAAGRAGQLFTLATVLDELSPSAREHFDSCAVCRTFAEELAEVRALFENQQSKVQPSPFFLTRVMASIAEREVQLEKSAQTWAAVPRLAYRLSLLASLGLLIAASWVYQMPKSYNSAGLNSQQSTEGLADSGPVQDDMLVDTVSR